MLVGVMKLKVATYVWKYIQQCICMYAYYVQHYVFIELAPYICTCIQYICLHIAFKFSYIRSLCERDSYWYTCTYI